MLPIMEICDYCGATSARQLSDSCLMVYYCDAECQSRHWNR